MDGEQLDLFEDLDVQEVYVKMTITYQTKDHPGIPHLAFHQFVDLAPEFELSQGLYEAYSQWDQVHIDVQHEEPPEPLHNRITHYGPQTLQ